MDTALIPDPWLALWAQWAPYLLGALVLATGLVHVLLPVARAVERWAITTATTRDDGPAHRAVEILEWLAGLSRVVLSLVPRLAMGGFGERDTKPSKKREPITKGPPDSGALALALVVVAAALSTLTSGCSAGPQTAGTGAATSPSCQWVFTVTTGGERVPDAGPSVVQLCHDCTIERLEMSCLFDRTGSDLTSRQTGNDNRGVRVSPDVRTSVSATGGTGGATP